MRKEGGGYEEASDIPSLVCVCVCVSWLVIVGMISSLTAAAAAEGKLKWDSLV